MPPKRTKSSSDITESSKRQIRRRAKIEEDEDEEQLENSTIIDLEDNNEESNTEEDGEFTSKPSAKRKRLSLRSTASSTTVENAELDSPPSASSSNVSFAKVVTNTTTTQPKKRGRKPKSVSSTPAPKSENEDENYENDEEEDASAKIFSFKTDQHYAKNHTAPAQGKRSQWKQLKQIVVAENYFSYSDPLMPTFVNIESPVSRLPAKKYCDLTGFTANYTLPHPPYIRYHSHLVYKEILPLVKFPQEIIQARIGNTNPNQLLLAAVVNNSLTSTNATSSPVNVEE